ncbi:hypothetical protein FSARC_4722 [Fusarium sarcochroum]|uniref:Uncharacterized protein n=1 Tax=Fusarium sarcochroum TaxID=1208366 RepID=A0A8H4XB82_9HYPO|nr:hypothetical protein FSARC_4722 [Fusarium sarcochroum]
MSFSSFVYHGEDEPFAVDGELQAPGMPIKEDFTITLGIGTVRLKTKRFHNKGGTKSQGEIVLKNVLHAPHYICNIIGGNIAEDGYVVTLDPDPEKPNSGIIRDETGAQMAHFKRLTGPNQQIEVRLSGPPHGPEVGKSPFNPEKSYEIRANWESSERDRLETYRETRNPGVQIGDKPFTEKEKEWFKSQEMDFEQDIKPAGRHAQNEEVRKAMRTRYRYTKMKNPNQDLVDKVMDFKECRLCDSAFPTKERRYIRTCFGSTKEFMDKFGYRYDKHEEYAQAAKQAKKMMRKNPEMEDADRLGEDGWVSEDDWEDVESESEDDGFGPGGYRYEYDVEDVYGSDWARYAGSDETDIEDIECDYWGPGDDYDTCRCMECRGRRIMMADGSD